MKTQEEPLFQVHAVKALAHKGLRVALESPSTYVALFVFYLLTGYLFMAPLFLVGQATIKTLIDFEPIILSFFVPALTMGLLSEELKSGTFETLATFPLEDWDIVLGKYLGFASLYTLVIAALLFFAVGLAFLVAPPAHLDWGESIGTLCALTFEGLLIGAAGLYTSSFSKNQIVSFITAFLIGFSFVVIGKFAIFLPTGLSSILDFIGLDSHMQTMGKGVLDTRDLLYFASFIFIFLYLTAQKLSHRRIS